MFEIVFLGTSASAPSIYRGLPSQAILAGEHRFLIDCGEGTQRQILKSGIGFKKLNRILLTHAHLDHILGLGGLVSTFVRWEDIEELEIYGGTAALNRVQTLLFDVVLANQRTPIPIHLIDLKAGEILSAREFNVSTFPVQHRGPGNFGFVFQEHTHHPFNVEKAIALGVPAGPERGRLVKGEAITLVDGRTVTPEMVLGEAIPGTKLVHIGDIGRLDESIAEQVKDAHALVMESTFLEVEADVAAAHGHITAKQAAEFARDNGVKTLILTHISRRYGEREVIAEARDIFPNTYVARDLDHYIIHRDRPVEKVEKS
ncbi:MAG: ribonuclease Z [Aggregatilineales bacterium]